MGEVNYIDNLMKLDFEIQNQDRSSVYLVSNFHKYMEDGSISPYIIIALDKAKLFDVDAVYFRLFDDGRPPMAQLYIYDNINNKRDKNRYAIIHRDIWSGCEIPAFMIIDKTTIKVFDSRKPIEIGENGIISNPIEIIDLQIQNDIIERYKAQLFDNGAFWESPIAKNNFVNNKVASERLIQGLRIVREDFNDKIKDPELADRLLIICILIKYLEENGKDPKTQENLAHNFFFEATGLKTLEEIIRNNKVVELFDNLARHFNGGIFQIEKKWVDIIKETDLSALARFFEADYKNHLFGWREYSFEHIPIELISNFYEEFLPKEENSKGLKTNKAKNGAVYTPSFVVDLLVDECLPLSLNSDDLNENVKLIDPACGSGIFLVVAYKRLVQRWRIKNRTGKQLADTTPNVLKEILRKNIFGVDLHHNSTNLSIFSLQLALCSMLTPKQIWTELDQFDNLTNEGNIVRSDFFDFLLNENIKHDFDLVIGNPPYKRNDILVRSYIDKIRDKYPIKFDNSENELSLLFLEAVMYLLKDKTGKLCLILPSSPILYSDKSLSFRKGLFNTYNIKQIIDLTFFRRVLFKSSIPTLVIFIEKKRPIEKNPITHVIAKRTKPSKEKSYFEFDYYDFHEVPKQLSVVDPNIWMSNLMGGIRVFHLVKKIQKMEPKIDTLKENGKIQTGAVYREHLLSSNSLNKNERVVKNIQLNFLDNKDITNQDSEIYYWSIRQTLNPKTFPEDYLEKNLKNRTKVPDTIEFRGRKEILLELKEYLTKYKSFVSFYIATTSGRPLIRPYTIYLSDILSCPYVNNLEHFFTEIERITIDDVATYQLDVLGNGEKAIVNRKLADKENIKRFSDIYCNLLNIIYADKNAKYRLAKLTEGNSYYACDYIYDSNMDSIRMQKTDVNIDNLLYTSNLNKNYKYSRVMRIYYDNGIRIIKPKQLRYWLESIALRDADDTFSDILNQD
ncbi:HsdM family class I SAM-dependent methyltransferase [Dysgonomonas massiliensis]|uniref:HsdM family class I SAM-dependent methyltransferase n=1 Tax=Dysgonomonas massiliensis TaxID=2040292 RepID=UPI000C77F187|nr:N-6 DNA methylase [Dysgonomonas massiliensis]